jgi:uncharacterized protein YprB with RNaseH-like and TPR domain
VADDSLRRRLEALNRAAIEGPIRKSDAAAVEIGVSAAASQQARPRSRPNGTPIRIATPPEATGRIPGLLRRGEVVQTRAGEHIRICIPLEWLWPGGGRLVSARQQFLQQQLTVSGKAANAAEGKPGELVAFVAALPDRTLLLDLETCGLAGAALFLVGVLRQIDGSPGIELLLARNYAEEAAVLASLWQLLATHDVLVTFNGKSFDWPMVLERSIRHQLRPNPGHRPRHHLDILHHSRRRWRKELPDCRLQTLEKFICRRGRTEDIPGHRIPGVYAEFVRTGFERDMEIVLHHNAIDLITLFDLSLRLAG